MQTSFLEAWTQQGPHRVLGHLLHPLCLADVVGLRLIESPFCDSTSIEHVTALDLQLAVLVCSTPKDGLVDALRVGPGSGWSWRRVKWLWWSYRVAQHDLKREVRAFLSYLEAYYQAPDMWSGEDSKSSGIPWPLSVVGILMRKSTLTWADAWAMPLGRAIWLACSLADQETGESRIMSEAELDAERHVLQLRKQRGRAS